MAIGMVVLHGLEEKNKYSTHPSMGKKTNDCNFKPPILCRTTTPLRYWTNLFFVHSKKKPVKKMILNQQSLL